MTKMVKDSLNVTTSHSRTTSKRGDRSVALPEVRMLHRAPKHKQGALSNTASSLVFILRGACSWGTLSYKRAMLRFVIHLRAAFR